MRKLALEQFHAEVAAQGMDADNLHVAFICPVCKTVQSAALFNRAGVTTTEAKATHVGFCCIGRFTGAGTHTGAPPGRGCNYTLGGLFKLHELEVTMPGGTVHPTFDLATPEQAKELRDGLV